MSNNGVEKEKLFDMKDIDDLPEKLRSELRLLTKVDRKILRLFEDQGELNINQLLVGFFRMYGISKTRVDMTAICYRMKKKGFAAINQE